MVFDGGDIINYVSHPILRVIGILDIWRWGRFSGKLNMLPVSQAIVLGCCLIHQMTKWLRESQDCNNTPLRMKYAKVKSILQFSKLAKNEQKTLEQILLKRRLSPLLIRRQVFLIL